MFKGLCIVLYVAMMIQQDAKHTVYLYLQTALHGSGRISTHHQEFMSLYPLYLALIKP
jgi:predicted 2-oxoglutarate/Fe(II)-dependent dioxygenase YbiX